MTSPKRSSTVAGTVIVAVIVLASAATTRSYAGPPSPAMRTPTSQAARAATPPTKIDPQAIATELLDNLDAGRFDAAAAHFNATMRAAVPAAKLQQIWGSLPAAKGRNAAQVSSEAGVTLVVIPLHRAGLELIARIAVTASGEVTGFFVQPAPPPAAATAPVDANYVESEFAVGTGPRALPGTLAMPKGAGPFPAVVLVHGSGPQDRDETIGGNRPFLDIARALASRGIAVLRYEKRTHARPQDYAGGTVSIDSETTDDAVAAVNALRLAKNVDQARVFVFGHSQGAMLAPRIAARAGHVAGVVMLAAPARRLLDILPEQNRFLANLDGNVSRAEKAYLQRLDATIAAVRAGRSLPASQALMGQPTVYWRSTDAVHSVAELGAINVPALLLQGGRDFQVTAADWAFWQHAFQADARVTMKRYDALNHLGIAGDGAANPAEYQQPGHVDAALIADVAAWIAKH